MERITLERIFCNENIERALNHVVRRNASPGSDNIKAKDVPEKWRIEKNKILTEIYRGEYKPSPLKIVFIRKKNKVEKRRIYICTGIDQMLQHCIRYELDSFFTPFFHSNSYGFISGRGTYDALDKCLEYMNAGYHYVIDADIRKCFDKIKHKLIIKILEENIDDSRVICLIRAFLKNPAIYGDRIYYIREGVPQGSCLGPILANVVLNYLDWNLHFYTDCFVRYADDLVVFTKAECSAGELMGWLECFLSEKLSLTLNMEKTNVLKAEQLVFLGYGFCKINGQYKFSLNPSEKEIMLHKMERHIKCGAKKDFQWITKLGGFNRGWINYYKKINIFELRELVIEMDWKQMMFIQESMQTRGYKNPWKMLEFKGYIRPLQWLDELIERNEYEE